jgi:uncharacterized protein (DUF924 family)
MKTYKHTPAPWNVKNGQFHFVVESETGVNLAEIEKIFDDDYFENCKANAHLISAAPELLSALEFLLDAFERHTAGFSEGYEINNLACENAKNAIEKALNKNG